MAKKEIYNIEVPQGNSGKKRNSNTRNSSNRSNNKRNSNNARGARRNEEEALRGNKGKKKLTRSQKRRKKRKTILIIEVIVLLLLLAALFLWLKVGLINWDDLKDLKTNNLDEETQELLDDYTTIALFGVDNRSNGNYDTGNSDSIMICSINNNTKEVKLVSVYRDTCLDVDGDETFRKCNYA